jgi:hypothetical protein
VKIRFNTQPSRFTELIEAALRSAPEALAEGQTVSATVPIHAATKRGFERTVVVTIGEDPESFETSWNGPDPARFGGRLRAAATALRDLGYTGSFSLERDGRFVSIRRSAEVQ